MQEFRNDRGGLIRDVIEGNTAEELRLRMLENEARRISEGYHKTEERMLTKNSKCTCGSGKKIKRCCKFIR